MKTCVHLNGGQKFKGVLHIGAHAGEEFSSYIETGVERVAWFEANPNLIPQLKSNTANESVEQYYYNVCLSENDGEKIVFNFSNNGQSSSILELGTHAKMYPHIQYTGRQEMVARRMDKVILENFKELDIRKYDFINLDVQGAELKVLKGFGNLLAKEWIKGIYTELNFEEVYKGCALAHEIDAYLKPFGFTRILTQGECPQWGDGYYLRLPK
jgi:FkbM family methyltransferase